LKAKLKLLFAFIFGLVLGSVLSVLFVRFLDEKMEQHHANKIAVSSETAVKKAMAAFKEVVIQNGGLINDTIYEDLAGHREVESVSDLCLGEGSLIGFSYQNSPTRISTNLADNAELIIFTAGHGHYMWLGLADGSVKKIDFSKDNPHSFSIAYEKHSKLMQTAGYPSWTNRVTRRKWLEENANHLVWDAKMKLYRLPPR